MKEGLSADALIGLNRSVTTAHLLGGTVHEVNNALQVISGTLELLHGQPDIPDSVARALDRVRAQSDRAAGAVAQLLTFTKAARHTRDRVNLREVAASSVALRQFAIRRAGHAIRLAADPASSFVVLGNRGELQQALLNVIINAEQALEGTTGSIDVALEMVDGWAQVRVEDSGPGIRMDPPASAFDAFVSTRPPLESAGLGLWAARAMVERHGGTIALQSTVPTAVVMRLPLASDQR